MFCREANQLEFIPPMQSALLEHSKRAAYQTGNWATGDISLQHAPSPEGWGWTMKKESILGTQYGQHCQWRQKLVIS